MIAARISILNVINLLAHTSNLGYLIKIIRLDIRGRYVGSP